MSTKKQNLFNFIFISVVGTLLHFTYKWSDYNPLVALFSAVNESTWEHLKLLFFPMLLLTLLELIFKNKLPDYFLQARIWGIISGMVFIVVTFYTFNGVAGRNIDWVNILIYFLGVIFALWIENRIQKTGSKMSVLTAVAILVVLTLAFFVFTFKAPDIGLFTEPKLS